MSSEGMWEPVRVKEVPLWEVNHSPKRLKDEERMDYTSYKLGYEMKEEVDDPENKAYKFFSNERYPEGNMVDSAIWDYDPSQQVALCMDFNRRPQAACLAQKAGLNDDGDPIYGAFDECWLDEGLTREQADNVINTLQEWDIDKVYLYGDNTSNQRAGRYGRHGKNDWQTIKAKLEEADIKYDSSKLRTQNPHRKVRVDKVNNVIYSGEDSAGNPIRRLWIHERCKKLIRDYRYSIVASSGKDEGLKIDDGDKGHISDAMDYFIYENERGGRGLTYIM